MVGMDPACRNTWEEWGEEGREREREGEREREKVIKRCAEGSYRIMDNYSLLIVNRLTILSSSYILILR